MRRKVAILLTVCLLIGLVPMSAWAETESVKAANAEEIVNVMTKLKDYVFAYGLRGDVSTDEQKAECLKNSMAEELTEKRIGCDCSLGEALNEKEHPVISATLKGYITVGTASEATDSETGLYYFDYEIKIPKADAGTSEDVVTDGKVYVLDSITDVLVKTVEGGAPVFTVLKQKLYKEEETNDYFEYPRFMYSDVDTYEDDHDHRLPDMEVFGNGVVANVLESEDENVYGFQIVQEHCGNLVPQNATPSQRIGGTLILSKNEDAVRFSYKEDAAAWNFSDVKTFVPTEDEENPPIAQVFYGVENLTIEAADFQNWNSERTITDIEVQGNLSNVFGVTEENKKWNINLESSYYDVVPLKFTYDDGSVCFLTINKVGIDIKAEKKITDDGARKYFTVWHGTDQTIRYEADAEADNMIIATFYHANMDEITPFYQGTPTEAEYNAFKASVSEALSGQERMTLFVTVVKTDGSTEHYSIAPEAAITTRSDALAVGNGGRDNDGWKYEKDYDCAPGYAGQGKCHLYDDYILWQGTDEAFNNIERVSAIAYIEGTDGSFKGVRIGSAAGVVWSQVTQ